MMSTPDEQVHVAMSRKWTSAFRTITKKQGVPCRRFDLWTVSLLKAISAKNLPVMSYYCERRDGILFAALNSREKKRVCVLSSLGGFTENFAHTSIWGPGYEDYPDLTFVVVDAQLQESLAEFAELLKRFVQAKTKEEVSTFEKSVYKQYNHSNR